MRNLEKVIDRLHDEDESVRHLVELGYVDPDVVALRNTTLRQQLEAELQAAQQLYQQGNSLESERIVRRLARDDPDWSAPRQLLAELAYRASRTDEAEAELEWLAEHAVENPRLAFIAGAIAIGRRNLSSALEQLGYARHFEPDLPSIDSLMGTAQLRLSQLDLAEQSFQSAVDKNPKETRAFEGLAAVHLRRGDFELAADAALQALELDMQLYSAHCRLGLSLANLGRPHEALTALKTAAKISPGRAAPYYWMSRIATMQLGDSIAAAEYRSKGREVVRRRRSKAT